MALFTNLTVNLLSGAEESQTSEGVPVYKVKAYNEGLPDSEPIMVSLMINRNHEHASDFKSFAEMTKKDKSVRLLVTGVMEYILPVKEKDDTISKKSRLNVYVISMRRLSLDPKIQPASAHVYGSGFAEPVEFKGDRKAQLNILTGTQSLEESGAYCSRFQISGDKTLGTDEICLRITNGQEIYFAGTLYRLEGKFKPDNKDREVEFDKITANATFIEETDRVKAIGGRRNKKSASMASQMTETFEEADVPDEGKSVSDLAKMAGIALDDF